MVVGRLYGVGSLGEVAASGGENWIEDRELEPTSAEHPRFGRKDETEARWVRRTVLDGENERQSPIQESRPIRWDDIGGASQLFRQALFACFSVSSSSEARREKSSGSMRAELGGVVEAAAS